MRGVLQILILLPVTVVLSTAAIVAIPFSNGKYYHGIARLWSKIILNVCGVHVNVRGLEYFPRDTHAIVVTNHASMMDIPIALTSVPDNLAIMFKKELGRVPIWGWSIKYGHYIIVDRSNPRAAQASFKKAKTLLATQASVLLFAEGTRSLDGNLQPFRRGAFHLASQIGGTIVPVSIDGSSLLLSKGKAKARGGNVTVTFHEPIECPAGLGRAEEIAMMNEVHRIIRSGLSSQ